MDYEITIRIGGAEVVRRGTLDGDAVGREEQAVRAGREAGCVLAERGLNDLLAGADRPSCCGEPMSKWGRCQRTVIGVQGDLRIEGTRFRCQRCGRERRSTDDVGYRGHAVTVPLARRVCRLAITEHFTQMEDMLLEQHGLRLGHDLMATLVHEAGGEADRRRRDEAEIFERTAVARREPPAAEVRPRRVVASCDGIVYCTNLREPDPLRPGENRLVWHEIKVGCVYWQDEKGRWRKRVLWGREGPEEFGRSLYLLACRCGWREAEERVFAADGAAWCWSIRDRYFPDAVPILDWFHAAEHVWTAARVVARHAGEEDVRAWAGDVLDRLYDEGGRAALARLRELRQPLRGARRKAVNDLLRYLGGHVERTRYPTYRDHDWPIGTGMIESTAKQLVATRLKGPDMHWTDAGAIAVTALRAQSLNQNWGNFWTTVNTVV